MSHYPVLVIGENPENQLEPFYEGLDVSEYINHPVTDKDKMDFLEYYKKKENKKNNRKGQSYKDVQISLTKFPKYYQKYGDDWNGNAWRIDSEGNWQEYSTYNPESKWDWYSIGGRWSGMLLLKKSEQLKSSMIGCRDVIDETSDEKLLSDRRVDQARKCQIDWEGMCQRCTDEANKRYDNYKQHLNYLVNDSIFSTYAVLDHGEWNEPGQMGWWGMSSVNEQEKAQWNNEFFTRFIESKSDNTLLTVVDCHI